MDAAAEYIIRARDFGIKVGKHYLDKGEMFKDWNDLFSYLKLPVGI